MKAARDDRTRPYDSGDRLERRQVRRSRRVVPARYPAGAARSPVQAAEHVEQRRGVRGRRGDRPRPGRAGTRRGTRSPYGLQPGAAETADRPGRANRRARPTGRRAGRRALPGRPRPSAGRGDGEFRPPHRHARPGHRRRRRQPGRGQSAGRRHCEHGLCPRRGRARVSAWRHRPRRRDCRAGRHARRAGLGRRRADRRIRGQQVPRRSDAVRRRRVLHRAAHRLAVFRRDPVGACRGRASRGRRCAVPTPADGTRRTSTDCRADVIPLGELRRRRPVAAGAGRGLPVRTARPADSARRGRRDPVRHQIDARRHGVSAHTRLGSRRAGARQERRARLGRLRRVPDVGPPPARPRWNGRPGGVRERGGAARPGNRDGGRKDRPRDARALCPDRRRGHGVRNSRRAVARPCAGTTDVPTRNGRGRRPQFGRARRGNVSARAVRQRPVSP